MNRVYRIKAYKESELISMSFIPGDSEQDAIHRGKKLTLTRWKDPNITEEEAKCRLEGLTFEVTPMPYRMHYISELASIPISEEVWYDDEQEDRMINPHRYNVL